MALAAALICVVLMSGIIAGAFIATTEEVRMSANSVSAAMVLDAAESAAENQIVHWTASSADSVPVGAIRVVSGTAGPPATNTWLIRLDSTVFWVVAEARGADQTSGHAVAIRQRIGLLVRTVRDSAGATMVFPLEQRSWALLY